MHFRWSRLLFATAVAGARIRNAGAQEPRPLTHPDSVPYELAAALASGGFAESQIIVGSAPGWAMQRLFVPTNARVLGSSFIGTNVTTIIELPLGADSAATDQVRSELMQRGWTEPPRPTYGGGGFRPATTTSSGLQSPTRFTLCNGDNALSGDVRRHAGVSLFLVYRLSSGATTGFCHPPVFQGRPSTPIRLPTLYEPPGPPDPRAVATCFPQCSGESNGTDGFFRTPMPAEQILEHFARQLADSGWVRARDTVTLARGQWTRPDSSGAVERLILTITVPQGVTDAQCHQAEMRVTLPRKP